MSTFADRIVAGLRAAEQRRPYGLDRAIILDDEEALEWLWEWQGDDGRHPWRQTRPPARGPRVVAGRLLWLRWVHHRDWVSRGGRDGA